MRWFPRPTVLVVILLLCACSERKSVPAIYNCPPCVWTRRVVDDGFMTPRGITVGDVQNTVLGSHEAPLTWRHEEEIAYGVAGTSTTLLVEITRKGAATLAEAGEEMGPVCCSPKVLIPVHVKAMTQDGVFSIEGDSEVEVSSERTTVEVLSAVPRGPVHNPGAEDKRTAVDTLGINLAFRRHRLMVGSIGGAYSGNQPVHLLVPYACFPDSPPFHDPSFTFWACGE